MQNFECPSLLKSQAGSEESSLACTHTHIPWTETLILAAAGRQNSHNQSTWNTCRHAKHCIVTNKKLPVGRGRGERERACDHIN